MVADVFYGLERYKWEHWFGSHPDLVPCAMHDPSVALAGAERWGRSTIAGASCHNGTTCGTSP